MSARDAELEAAAAEVGISPYELERAIATRGAQGTSASIAVVEGSRPGPPERALECVRRSLEAAVGAAGHAQGKARADIVDERHALTYRIHVHDDGAGAAYMRIEVDARQATVQRRSIAGVQLALGAVVVAAGVGIAAPWLWVAGLSWMALATVTAVTRGARDRRVLARAAQVANAVLMDEAAPALPEPAGAPR